MATNKQVEDFAYEMIEYYAMVEAVDKLSDNVTKLSHTGKVIKERAKCVEKIQNIRKEFEYASNWIITPVEGYPAVIIKIWVCEYRLICKHPHISQAYFKLEHGLKDVDILKMYCDYVELKNLLNEKVTQTFTVYCGMPYQQRRSQLAKLRYKVKNQNVS